MLSRLRKRPCVYVCCRYALFILLPDSRTYAHRHRRHRGNPDTNQNVALMIRLGSMPRRPSKAHHTHACTHRSGACQRSCVFEDSLAHAATYTPLVRARNAKMPIRRVITCAVHTHTYTRQNPDGHRVTAAGHHNMYMNKLDILGRGSGTLSIATASKGAAASTRRLSVETRRITSS